MKLNLGCYNKKIYGFTNVDIRPEVNPDIVDNAFSLDKFKNNSVDLILCIHMFEHLSWEESEAALTRWYEVLKPNGMLRLSVPDMEAVFSHYIYHKQIETLHSFIWGSQKHDFDFHKSGYTFDSLTNKLTKFGFKNIRRYDWQQTEHHYIDDYSQAYLPHMDKINGKLMSLNIEAIK